MSAPPFSTDKTVKSTLWTFTPLNVFILSWCLFFLLLELCKQQSLTGSCFWACLQIWSDTLFQHKSCAVLCFCQTERDYHRDLLYQSFQMISMKTGKWKGLNFCITFTLKRGVLYRGQDSWTTGMWAKKHKEWPQRGAKGLYWGTKSVDIKWLQRKAVMHHLYNNWRNQ